MAVIRAGHKFILFARQNLPTSNKLSSSRTVKLIGTYNSIQFCQEFYANDEFRLFFESFLGFYSEKKTFSLSHEQGLFLKHFLSVEASPRVFSIK